MIRKHYTSMVSGAGGWKMRNGVLWISILCTMDVRLSNYLLFLFLLWLLSSKYVFVLLLLLHEKSLYCSCIESWWRSRKTFHFNHGQSRDLVLVKCRTKFLCLFGEQQQSTTLFSHSKNGPSNSNEKPSWMGLFIYYIWFSFLKISWSSHLQYEFRH